MGEKLAVVVGATGTIGRAFVAELLDEQEYDLVVGVGRGRPADWPACGRAPFFAADLLDETALAEVALKVAELGEPTLILIATGRLHGPGIVPEKAFHRLSKAALIGLFEVNAVLPALVAKHLAPLAPNAGRFVIAALSARVGSLGDNQLGGWHSYRASKAALNMLIRGLAIELQRQRPEAICVAVHPGTVASPLSEPFLRPGAPRATPKAAAAKILDMLRGLGPADTGQVFAYDGARLPW